MGSALPELSCEAFGRRLRSAVPSASLTGEAERALFLHYEELRRWNPRLSLVGPGTAGEVVERHYGESLAALPLLSRKAATLVDVGSGAGFPGLVLAAARPELEVTLVEPRQRKWGFLRSVCRRAGLPCHCLDARVGHPLPEGLPARVDVVTVRALGGITGVLDALLPLLSCEARVLVWRGRDPVLWPDGLREGRRVPLAGSQHRWIEEARRKCPEDAEHEG